MFITEDTQGEIHDRQAGMPSGNDEETIPQPDLFSISQASSIHQAQCEYEQNEDLLAVTQLKMKNLKRTLVEVPVEDIQRIVEINDRIRMLETDIQQLSETLLQLKTHGGGF